MELFPEFFRSPGIKRFRVPEGAEFFSGDLKDDLRDGWTDGRQPDTASLMQPTFSWQENRMPHRVQKAALLRF